MEPIDQLLSDLVRLEQDALASGSVDAPAHSPPDALRHFAVVAASPLALDSVEIVSTDPAAAGDPPIFSAPSLASPFADPEVARRELERYTQPLFALEHLSPYATGSYVFPEPRASRFLAQLPMASARAELVPQRRGLVLDPLALSYEFRAVDASRTSVDASFSSALAKQDEYARGKMTNKPFSPGGDSLVALRDSNAGAATHIVDNDSRSTAAVSTLSPDELARNELVLSDNVDLSDEATLERLVLRAPGLDGALSVADVRALEQSTTAPASDAADNSGGLDVVGSNPRGLLEPYFGVAADREHVEAVRRFVADEKAASALAQATHESGTLALDELLHDLEDDDDLGFYVEDAADDDMESKASDSTAAAVVGSEVLTLSTDEQLDSNTGTTEPEAELEAILRSSTQTTSTAADGTSQSQQPTTTEWASLARVDVRNFHEKVPTPAIAYAFELDTFQKECVVHLERHECVFVAAHTSAGKTVVAEYAIALSQQHMTRTIYTSPIKALSNQKYRDFRTTFGADRVGLITGDVSINPDASCLVMTTEILRSMLYRGADVIRDIEWVIFDEIHYINDSERGVVWEEVIIMLPEHIGMVFLSATTPNHLEFSDWIGRTKQKRIHVISTTKRPVPLQHFLYAGKELFKLFDATHGYLPGAYSAAKTKLLPATDKPRGGGTTVTRGGGSSSGGSSTRNMGRTSGGDQSDWTKLITSLKDKALLPVVVFAFSKRLCEESASKLSKLDLSTPSERSEIHVFLETSIQRLQGSDRELPQVVTMKEMLKRGIGVHHGGLLPIIKEMVEILFGRGLVKVLFSTETFAMGVNMPARTVVFNGIRKHDGKSFRDLLPGEYTQMAGRAGRRGLDLVGTVIIACWNDVPEPTSLQTMLAGRATSLSSQFRLTYNMILNLLRVEVLTVEDMMKRSFSEFQTQKALAAKNIPQLIQRGRRLLATLETALRDEYPQLESSGELAEIQELYALKKLRRETEKRVTTWLLTHAAGAARTAIAPGRVIVINAKGLPTDVRALVVRTNSNPNAGSPTDVLAARDDSDARASQSLFKSITVLFLCADDYVPPAKSTGGSSTSSGMIKQSSAHSRKSPLDFGGRQLRGKRDDRDTNGLFGATAAKTKDAANELASNTTDTLLGRRFAVLDIPETCIDVVTSLQAATVNFKTLVAASSKKELASSVEFLVELERAPAAHLALVDVVSELKLKHLDIVTMVGDWQTLQQRIATHACTTNAGALARVLGKVDKISKLQDYVARLTRELSNDSLSLFPDFQQRLAVLKRLGYISGDGVVQVKGRVACEINTCEEIVLTEMIFENVLAHLEPEEIVAVLSALIFQEKTQSEPTLTPRLDDAREVVKRIAESLGLIQLEMHLDIDPAVYCKGALNFGLMEVVYEWSRGMPFKELCLLTDVQEGSIVRCITRLDEVCREVRNAARVIGDPELYRKMEVASESIKRDVVFASSLYLT